MGTPIHSTLKATKRATLSSEYLRLVIAAIGNDFSDNYDARRFGPLDKPRQTWADLVRKRLARRMQKRGLIAKQQAQAELHRAVAFLEPHSDHLEWVHEHLAEETSRELLVNLLAFRALGHRRVRLPLNQPEYWATLKRIEALTQGAETMDLGFLHFQAYKLNLESFGIPIELFVRTGGVLTQMLLQQYRCELLDRTIQVEPGDVVIDGGACYGDTALHFAHKAGEAGRVFSFEFLPENVKVFETNMELNPALAHRIRLVQAPLWSHSGELLFVEGTGPATRVSPTRVDPAAAKVWTQSIDDLVAAEGLERLDFIKMDIEGAEQQALLGAAESIRRFRPKLAISVYHKLEDFWQIPQYLENLDLGYRFSLRHFTIHAEETVLFADPGPNHRP